VDDLEDEVDESENKISKLERRLEESIKEDQKLKCPQCSNVFDAKEGL
jgi:hypothetical protein